MEGRFDLEEGYNIKAAQLIKPILGDIPLMVVGGMRKLSHMEEVIENGYVDFISMCRPFIREPNIVNRFNDGKAEKVLCVSCNRCLAGIANDLPVACYNKGFPQK
jgi:2,4-dienoyl-CoA reductase-like NADH-dependent reductase (Old Yellow Enzyme family)